MNKVVIVGGNHHNGLGLARSFGRFGIEVISVVIDEKITKSFLKKSKYVKESIVFRTEKEAFDFIKNAYRFEEKAFIIPYSDGAAEELDKRVIEFNEEFFIPSINNRNGEIVHLMDKDVQYKFAESNSIKMAKTCVVDLCGDVDTSPLPLPLILKPVLSAEGDKKDIRVCKNSEDTNHAIEEFREKGYKRVLAQEYLSIDYEIDVFGSILRNKTHDCIVPTRTIRSWPKEGGTNSFSQIITDDGIIGNCKKIISALKKYGFYGLYDIEIFVVGNDYYLNEMNLRNSGDVYMALDQDYHYVVAWYFDVLGKDFSISENPSKDDFCMTECADLRHVMIKGLGLGAWLRDFKKCKDFALKYKGDMRPAIDRYFYYVCKVLHII